MKTPTKLLPLLALPMLLCACDEKDKKEALKLGAPVPPVFGRSAPGSDDPDGTLARGDAGTTNGDYAAGNRNLGTMVSDPNRFFDGSVSRGDAGDGTPVCASGSCPVDKLASLMAQHGKDLPAASYTGPTFRRRESDKTPVRIGYLPKLPGQSRPDITYSSGMTIDTDGFIQDAALRRTIRRTDPHHQTETSMRYANGRSLDPTRVPFIVLPKGYGGADTGDLALVEYNGKKVYAIVGDRGPSVAIGEGSVALASMLGIPNSGATGGVRSGVTYTVFAGSGMGAPRDEAQLLSFIGDMGPTMLARRQSPTLLARN